MEDTLVRLLIPAIGLISGLIGTFVGLQNRALLAEVRREMAETENRLIIHLNGTYIRRAECELREVNTHDRVESLAREVRNKEAAS
jgi:hypothetical protein